MTTNRLRISFSRPAVGAEQWTYWRRPGAGCLGLDFL